MTPNPFPAKPLTVIDENRRARPNRRHAINLPLYAKAAEELIQQVLADDKDWLAHYHLIERWKIILTALMLFDIQLVQGPRLEKCVLYFMKRRGKLYVSVPVRVPIVSAIDMPMLRTLDPFFNALISSRFYQLRNWHGFNTPFSEFLWQSSRNVALIEAGALVDTSYTE